MCPHAELVVCVHMCPHAELVVCVHMCPHAELVVCVCACVHMQALGVERLTLLGRVTACRVVVESLEVEPGQLAALLAHRSRPHHSKSFSNTQQCVHIHTSYTAHE